MTVATAPLSPAERRYYEAAPQVCQDHCTYDMSQMCEDFQSCGNYEAKVAAIRESLAAELTDPMLRARNDAATLVWLRHVTSRPVPWWRRAWQWVVGR